MTMSDLKPHESLEGHTLPDGWTVAERLSRSHEQSGGHFSCGYLVQKGEARGYLKALDFFSQLPEAADPSRALEPLLKAFNFERDILDLCRGKRLSRIVTALTDGSVTVPGFSGPSTVQYIVFELADGDVRSVISAADDLDVAWAIRSLHHMAVGLAQLHRTGIAHQDVKPSNVLVFEGRSSSKLGDLGRAARRGEEPPHYGLTPAGDHGYAPPEFLYKSLAKSWDMRRIGCDLYHLGSMISSLFTTVAMTPLMMMGLPPQCRWHNWGEGFDAILPVLRPAFSEACGYVEDEVPEAYRVDVGQALRELCEPDPRLRGHCPGRFGHQGRFDLQWYISLFNRLAKTAEIRIGRLG